MLKKIILMWMVYFFSSTVFAAQDAFTCIEPKVKFQHNEIILHTDAAREAQLYFIKNTSHKKIWLTRKQETEPHASAGWSSSLNPDHWSAILITKPNFILNCQNEKREMLHCKKVIQLCESILTFKSPAGNYWFVENKSWVRFKSAVNKRIKKDLQSS